MAKLDKALTLEVTFPDGYIDSIEETMSNELIEAQRKWQVHFTEEEQDLVLRHSRNQLRSKVASTIGPWNYGDDSITLNLSSSRNRTVKLPKDSEKLEGVYIARKKNIWELSDADESTAVEGTEFINHFLTTLHAWARTAVFYGVGSGA